MYLGSSPIRIAAVRRRAREGGRFAWAALVALMRHDGPDLAAALAFFTLLSLFPMTSLSVLIMSTFIDEEVLRRSISDVVTFFLPTSEEFLQAGVDQLFRARQTASLVAFSGVLMGSTGLFMTATRSVSRVYGRRPRSWSQRSVTGVVITALMSMLFLSSIGMGITFRLAVHATEANAITATISPALLRVVETGTILVPFVLTWGAFAIIYKIAPRGRVGWRGPIVGACVAVLLQEPAKFILIWLADTLGDRNVIYGSLSSAVILLSGAWTVGIIFLYGASISKQVAVGVPKEAVASDDPALPAVQQERTVLPSSGQAQDS